MDLQRVKEVLSLHFVKIPTENDQKKQRFLDTRKNIRILKEVETPY